MDILEAMSKEKQQHEEDNFKPKTTLCILERLLKVLENGIVNSPRNAMYLVTHQRALLLKKLARYTELIIALTFKLAFYRVFSNHVALHCSEETSKGK